MALPEQRRDSQESATLPAGVCRISMGGRHMKPHDPHFDRLGPSGTNPSDRTGDAEDRLVDANLRRLARVTALPGIPGERQRAAWMPSGAGDDQPGQRQRRPAFKGLSVNQRRVIKFASAAAAAVFLASLVFEPTRQARVEAATIFGSLRNTEWRGLSVQAERVHVEGIHLDGQVDVRFREPLSLSRLMSASGEGAALSGDAVQSVYFDLAVRADDDADSDLVGLDVQARGAYSEADTWIFLQVSALPEQVLAESPEAAILVALFARGVLLDLDSLKQDVLSGALSLDATDESDHSEGSDDSPETGAAERGAAVSATVAADTDSVQMRMTNRSGFQIDLDGGPELDEQQARELEGLLHGLLSGTATAEQRQTLATQLERQAGQVTVEKQPDGSYLLRASQLTDDDPEDAALLKNAVLEITYRDGSGVESLTLLHFGLADGSLRVAFNEALADRGQAARQELTDAGVRPVDVGALVKMFSGPAAETQAP